MTIEEIRGSNMGSSTIPPTHETPKVTVVTAKLQFDLCLRIQVIPANPIKLRNF